MFKAISQLLAVQAAGSLTQKQRLLQSFSQNEPFRKLLYYALNPRLTYKISEQTLL